MKHIEEVLQELDIESQILLEDIPNIDLYMDQVIQLFENKFSKAKRTEDEKILTKTMINNYAKGKLFIPIRNKKYSKQHLILIALIYQLKGALSIGDIKDVLEEMNERILYGSLDLEAVYSSYLRLAAENTGAFETELQQRAEAAVEEAARVGEEGSYIEKALLIASMAHMSSLYRRTAEKLIDELLADKS